MPKVQRDVTNFPFGLYNTVDDQSIPDGAASDELNWLSLGDRIELRPGLDLLGSEVAGNGRISGLRVAKKQDGTEIVFRTRGRKLEYYDAAADAWQEVGSDVLPAEADGEDVAMSPYANLAGAALYLSSPNSSIYKIMVANPGFITDLESADFRGYLAIKKSRMQLWNRHGTNGQKDELGLYRSKIDKDEVSDYTAASNEAVGSAGPIHYTGTLAFKAAGAKRTCFLVRITDGVKTLYDDKNGGFTGNGTGTINYTTGEFDVTFSNATTGPVVANYYWEDATSGGIADFSYSNPRTAGQGYVLRQDDGGGRLQNVLSLYGKEYCLHESKTYEVTESADDLTISNQVFRDGVGIPNWRAAVPTEEGIYYIDDTDRADPHLRLMTLEPLSSMVVPKSVSKRVSKDGIIYGLNLKGYRFDKAACHRFGDYVLFACRTENSTENNRTLFLNRKTGAIDVTDLAASCFDTYQGQLLVGHATSANIYRLSGFDDDDSPIANAWEGNLSLVGTEQVKKTKHIVLRGYIQPDQSYDVSVSVDGSGFTYIGTITGQGSYVDRSQSVAVGGPAIGTTEVGGGSDGTEAYYYEKALRLRLSRFKRIKVRFEAKGIGYVSVNGYTWFDIQKKGNRILKRYR